jgi:hypothetical protein
MITAGSNPGGSAFRPAITTEGRKRHAAGVGIFTSSGGLDASLIEAGDLPDPAAG